MALVTLDEVKNFLGISLSDTSNDVKIQMFIDAVSQQIINFCETNFESTPVLNELHDGINADVIVPRNFPIISVEQVVFGCDSQGNNGVPLDPLQYSFTEGVIKLRYGYSPRGRAIVRVDYTYGYSAVPADVKIAAIQSVKAELARDSKNTEGIGSIRKQDEAINYNSGWDSKTGLPSQIVSKLQAYKVYDFPLSMGFAQRNW